MNWHNTEKTTLSKSKTDKKTVLEAVKKNGIKEGVKESGLSFLRK